MNHRIARIIMIAVATALSSGALVFAPSASQASTAGVYATSSTVAVNPDNSTAVYVKCRSTTVDCKGLVRYENVGASTSVGTWKSYSIARGHGAYVRPALSADQALYKPAGLGPSNAVNARVAFKESKPASRYYRKWVKLELRQDFRELRGTVTGPATNVTEVKVHRWVVRGNQLLAYGTVPVDMSLGSAPYTFGNVRLGTNNSVISDYRLSISARVKGVYREWFWRGTQSGTTYTGAKTSLTASAVRVGSGASPFQANFTYGSVTGTVASGTVVTVAGAPSSMSSSASIRKNLDVAYCADIYGSDTAALGAYRVDFIPRNSPASTDNRYAIKVKPTSSSFSTLWNDAFGSCLHARGYANHTTNLLSFPTGPGPLVFDPNLRDESHRVLGHVSYQSSPTSADRTVDVRAYTPGKPVLSWPIVKKSSVSSSSHDYSISGLEPGAYAVSIGRQSDCSTWYPSRYPNNKSHFTSASDRQTEVWKSFSKLSSLSSGLRAIAIAHGATYAREGHVPHGYAGWMYRDVCRHNGAGAYTTFNISSLNKRVDLTDHRGATISGRVTRAGGRTVKEMMVSVYSTKGVLVQRSKFTDGSGHFTIYGIQTGNYNVVVNSDSWRGLGRTFSGHHSKRVTAGHSYGIGTLHVTF